MVYDGFALKAGVEGGGGLADGTGVGGEVVGVGWEARVNPGSEATVEEVDVFCAHGAEHPPCSWRGEDSLLFVDDDGGGVGDAEGGHAAGKGFGCG